MRIFLTGATGYLGGSLAVRLAQAGHHVRGLTRTPETIEPLRALGLDPVLGTLDTGHLLAAEAATADAVINAADSDHAAAVAAMLPALAGTGKPFLHTSGSSIVGQPSAGRRQDHTYTEADTLPGSPWTPAPDKAARVAIDRHVLAAAHTGVRSAVVCNTMVYGTGTGLNPDSVQIPRLIQQARTRGAAVHIGPGDNIWSTVHLDDACDLYLAALDAAAPGSFYFAENGESSFKDLTTAIADTLRLPGPTPLDIDTAIDIWGHEVAVYALGSNSRVRGRTARTDLDWKPRHTSATDWIRHTLHP
ncbi:NAD-dependent epimerase/dehydratase family protein [Nonomuraea antimicrobica]|uniref:NAD-dependent epimerase/dehydratase family protein n=1 Tax=Nonomuraea antimicrobica TaxID=561173 RepID=A0ABP7DQT0_9ACTN